MPPVLQKKSKKVEMPSFTCDHCQETLKKAQLDKHVMRCHPASFSCIDCYKTFRGNDYKAHTSCITEVEKYHEKKITSVPIHNSNNNNCITSSKKVEKKQSKELIFKYSGMEKDLNKLFDGKAFLSLKEIKKALQKKHTKKVIKKFMEEFWLINPLSGEFKIDRKN